MPPSPPHHVAILDMHAIYSHTQNTYIDKNEPKHSEMGTVSQNPIQSWTVRSVHMCVHCTVHTILHRTDLIIFPLTLPTITIAPMMSIWRKGGGDDGVTVATSGPYVNHPQLTPDR